MFRSVVISCLLQSVLSQGSAQLTFSSNPVYSGDSVTLTCSYGTGVTLLQVVVEAFSGTRSKGFLNCNTAGSGNTTGVGVFQGTSFTGCPVRPAGATKVSVTLTASPELQLDYNCSTLVIDSSFTVGRMTSGLVSLQVLVVCPSPPNFQFIPIAFNDSDNGTIVCGSLNGRPAALLSLTVSGGRRLAEIAVNGSNWVAVGLPLPLSDWHGALVTCRVINNNCANMSITRGVMINHISVTGSPDVIRTYDRNVTLDCSTYIIGHPGVRYAWTVPPEAEGTLNLFRSAPHFVALQGQSGMFNCTATNYVTMKSVTVVFTVNNTAPAFTSLITTQPDRGWIGGVVAGVLVILVFAIVFCLLYKRGHFSKKCVSTSCFSKQRTGKNEVVTESSIVSNVTQPSIDREYDSLDTQRTSEPNYAQLVFEEQNSNSTTLYENIKSSKRHLYPD